MHNWSSFTWQQVPLRMRLFGKLINIISNHVMLQFRKHKEIFLGYFPWSLILSSKIKKNESYFCNISFLLLLTIHDIFYLGIKKYKDDVRIYASKVNLSRIKCQGRFHTSKHR